jgi:hypothetical protein
MATIFKTTDVNKHWHLLYLDQSQQELFCSTENNHVHPVQLVMSPDGSPRISVGEADGHTHDPLDIGNVTPGTPKKRPETEVVEEALDLFKDAIDYESDSRKKGMESYEFMKGEQWEKDVKRKLEADKRAHQVYNYIQAKIDVLSGLARQNRVDPKAFPVEGSDDGVADVATAVLMRTAKQNNLSNEEIRVFEDEVIAGRGLFHLGMSQNRNPLGDILIERFPWADGYFGAHQKLDGSDATHIHKAKWLSVGEAKVTYPDKAEQITEMIGMVSKEPENAKIELQKDPGSTGSSIERYLRNDEILDMNHRKVRLVEHEIKEFRTAYYLENQQGTLGQEVPKAVYEKVKNLPMDLVIPMEFPKERIRIVVTVGTELIKNFYPDRPYDGFSLIPVYAYKFDDGTFLGKVEAMKGAQREINKRGSQSIDIVNKMIGRGWFYDDDTFDDPREAEKFRNQAGGAGWYQKVASTDRPPVAADTPPFPNELLNMHGVNLSIMEGVSNINPGMSGMGKTGYESGSALARQQKSGLVGNERVFDNFILSKQQLFRKVFKMIQEYYTKERIARIVLSEASDPGRMEPLQVGGQEIPAQRSAPEDAEALQSIVKMLETKDLADYDIQIGEQIFSATNKEAQFMAWMEAAQHGMQVPPGMLIELSSLPNKGKWTRVMNEMQQQQMQMEQMKYQAEMQKAGRVPAPQPGNNQPPGGTPQ